MTTETIAVYTLEHGGGTFEAGTGLPFEPAEGYAVAMAAGTQAWVTDPADLPDVARLVAQEWDASFVGTWVAPDRRIHVDPVQYVRDLDRALAIGRENGQLAIYSFTTKEVIDL